MHGTSQANVGWVPTVLLAYVVAGVAAGLLFGHKSFLWAFLLAFTPTLFLSAPTHAVGMSLLVGWVAALTLRLQARRKRLV
jgi:4-amino-4-deoxy-L-arabinose transferase-like glycosyltransferase